MRSGPLAIYIVTIVTMVYKMLAIRLTLPSSDFVMVVMMTVAAVARAVGAAATGRR